MQPDLKYPVGVPFQWGTAPDNTLVVLEHDEGRYILLVAADNLKFLNGSDFAADLGDVITLATDIVEKFSEPISQGDLQTAERVQRAVATHLVNREVDSMGRNQGLSILMATPGEA